MADLSPFEGLPVTAVGIEMPSAAGGLRDPLKFDPVELHHGDEGQLINESARPPRRGRKSSRSMTCTRTSGGAKTPTQGARDVWSSGRGKPARGGRRALSHRISITVTDDEWDVLHAVAYCDKLRPQRPSTAARRMLAAACRDAVRQTTIAALVKAGRDYRAERAIKERRDLDAKVVPFRGRVS